MSNKSVDGKIHLELSAEDGTVFNVVTDNLDEGNPDLPLLRNPPRLEAEEDLTNLSHLNEPSVLHAIKLRYSQLNIYTFSGIVLIATNPFQRLDQLYSSDIINAYAGKKRGELEPHLFAIAEDAYRCMKRDGKNQSIVVSGESGAGKTVSAKYIMRYFASVESGNNQHDMSDTEKQILATNPIMEAFGNAKTTRNDNSSRFGKYLEILFDKKTSIIGARIRTYLLERSRLVFQPKTERNYHIFYQMVKGMSDSQKEELGLSSAEDFHYLSQGGEPEIEGVDDAGEFRATCDALELIGLETDKQFEVYKILAALLHLGNVEVKKTRNDAHLSSDEPSLVKACELLGVDPLAFSKWVVKKQINTRSEKIVSSLNHAQAIVARDSVAKYIYTALFDWLVDYVNQDLCAPSVAEEIHSFIGVLDIYGFEHFDKNSFEQFCINYANEKLQQEFNQHVFKLEQEEYVKEQIDWSFIEFADNQPCINLIEQRLGVLALLDEESRLPAGNDQSWTEKMYQTLAKPPTDAVFKKPRFGSNKFIIAHYALDVTYDTEGFIEKNRDTVSEGHLEVLKSSSNLLLQDILATVDKSAENSAQPSKKVANKKPTLGSMFKNSLIELMATINSTNVHYIRCIKPNEQKAAWEFDPQMVLSQLRACGVLETIRISCAGFPSRWTYEEFGDRYRVLVSTGEWRDVVANGSSDEMIREMCDKILKVSIDDSKTYQLGNTKIFFKAGMLAHLEKLRSDKLFQCAVLIQKNVRRRLCRKKYVEMRQSIVRLQALVVGCLVRCRIQKQKEERAATMIQTLLRMRLVQWRFQNALRSIVKLQSVARGRLVQKRCVAQRAEICATKIQTAWRARQGRASLRNTVRCAVFVQSCFRRRLAKKELATLKTQAKSVNHLKELQYNLENKVIELTQNLTAKVGENKNLVAEITKLQAIVEESHEARSVVALKEQELHNTHTKHEQEILQLDEQLQSAKQDFQASESRVLELMQSQENLRKEVASTVEQLEEAHSRLKERDSERDSLNATIVQLKSDVIELRNTQQSAQVSNGKSIPMVTASSPVSVLGGSSSEAINNELWTLLQNSKALYKEIVAGLLRGLEVPAASLATDLTRKEVLFPARIIIIIISDMWRLGLIQESEQFLGECFSVIQESVHSLKEEDAISHGAFWLSNTHELYSFVDYAEKTISNNETIASEMSEDEYKEYLKLVAVVKEDSESLSYNIYNMWMKKMEKELEKKAVSAVVLSQALPGFMAPDSSPFMKVFSQTTQYKMEDILVFFNSVYWSMKSYFFESQVINEVVVELLRFIDAFCFNDLILRRQFLSWKRGLQLNYNVTRLEEWCKSHHIPEGSAYLVHLLQAAKLLQLRKNSPDDIDIIYDICYALKPSQIQRLISQYLVADYEIPIAPAVLKMVADKVKQNDGQGDDYFVPTNPGRDFTDPFRTIDIRPFSRVEAYVPSSLNLPTVRRIIELVAKNAAHDG